MISGKVLYLSFWICGIPSLTLFLILSKIQISIDSLSNNFDILIFNYNKKCEDRTNIKTNTPLTHLENLGYPNSDILWLKTCLPTTNIILCFFYCSSWKHIFLFFIILLLLTELLHLSKCQGLLFMEFNLHLNGWLCYS